MKKDMVGKIDIAAKHLAITRSEFIRKACLDALTRLVVDKVEKKRTINSDLSAERP